MKLLFFVCILQLSFAATAQTQPVKIREGKHSITLQWISWDQPGTVILKKTGKNTYSVSGSQKEKGGTDFVSIKGTLTASGNNRELEFNGTIELRVSHNNNGETCVKNGPLTFKATGTRKYWRCQQMLNCDGVVTDYVDIYF